MELYLIVLEKNSLTQNRMTMLTNYFEFSLSHFHSSCILYVSCDGSDGSLKETLFKRMFGAIKLAYPRHLSLKCLYQARKMSSYVYIYILY